MFGSMFNDISILRKKKGGDSTSQVRVPLSYAPKRKFIERINEHNKNELSDVQVIAVTLPRMSFEITSIAYDPMRQTPRTNYISLPGTIAGSKAKLYSATPYVISFELNVYAKNHDDALQVVEQILPYFNPSYTATIKPLEGYSDIKEDVIVNAGGVSFTDDFEGQMEERRTIIYTLSFEMKINFYGPIREGKVIKEVDIGYFLPDDSDVSGWSKYSNWNIVVDPRSAGPDSDYTIVETVTFPGEGDSA